LMGQIVEVYLNLASEKFADFMAHDERSYTPDQFAMVLARLERSMIVPHSQVERMRNLAEMARECYVKKANEEEDFDEEMPDEFKDQMMYSLMKDPVRLPSGIVMDRTNILRHLLSTRNDPFTNLPMSEADLVPDVELKNRIKEWLDKKRADRQQSESR